jgi:hypothetical protein
MTLFPTAEIEAAVRSVPEFSSWVEGFNTFEEAWAQCEQGTWMLKYLLEFNPDSRYFHEIGLRAARRAMSSLKTQDARCMKALEAKERWLRGELGFVELSVIREEAKKAVKEALKARSEAYLKARNSVEILEFNHPYLDAISDACFVAQANCSAWNSAHTGIKEATSAVIDALGAYDSERVLAEVAAQAEDIRCFFPRVTPRTRFEREPVI